MTTTLSIISKAADILGKGGLVAFPTETVYGLGADASQPEAVHKIFQAKNRPAHHPLIVHIASIHQLSEWASVITPKVQRLAEAFWPGPLTLILPKQERVLMSVTGGQMSVGLRIPNHPIAKALLHAFGKGVAAPSANQFTHLSPTRASAVREELGESVDLILDGGACAVGVESTILDMTGEQPVMLRPGMITLKMITEVLDQPILCLDSSSKTRAPGMHPVHYAPTTKTILIKTEQIPDFLQAQYSSAFPMAFVMHTSTKIPDARIHYVKMPENAEHYAHDFYQTLRNLDHQQFKCIVIEAVPEAPEWEALRDRLQKASIVYKEK
jgi:L-threonylcarbamoyladenylate synthase